MAQLYFYVPDEISRKLKEKAKSKNLSLSKYLARIVKKEIDTGWPEGYFDEVCGNWEGDFPEIERPKPEKLEGIT